jgi:hypothetical protein
MWAAVVFLSWFLMETLFNWLAIQSLSESEFPFFPNYRVDPDPQKQWPFHPSSYFIKNWLDENGYRPSDSLVSVLAEGYTLKAHFYEEPESFHRIQILFLPNHSGNVYISLALITLLKDGRRIQTDNFFLPFGGFYPENWFIERDPWIQSLERLSMRHSSRLKAMGSEPVRWVDTPAVDVNKQHDLLYRLNTDLGFLVPSQNWEIEGRISEEGRYRIWKEYWMLAYLGKSMKYS